MDRQAKSRKSPAIRSIHQTWMRRAAATCLGLGLLCSVTLVAQNEPANLANQPPSATPSPQNQVTFKQQSAPAATPESALQPHRRQYTFPENECSADFWDPYVAEAAAMTQSSVRVQQSSVELIDPRDTVQTLPEEVVEPAETVQQLDNEVVQPAERVQQLDDEVVQPERSLGDMHPTRSWEDEPGDHPD